MKPTPFLTSLGIAAVLLSACWDTTAPRVGGSGWLLSEVDIWFWAPDGEEIIYVERYIAFGSRSIQAVHATTGQVRIILQRPPDGRILDPNQMQLSPDGKDLYFMAFEGAAVNRQRIAAKLYRVPVAGQAPAELLLEGIDYPEYSGRVFAVSLDKNRVALYLTKGDFATNGDLVIVTRTTGQRDTLSVGLAHPGGMLWSPDSRQLLVATNGWMTLYDVDAGTRVDWDTQPALGAFEVVGALAVRWVDIPVGGVTPAVYAIHKTGTMSADARVVRYDFASRTSSAIGVVHGDIGFEAWYSGYSASPDLSRVAWSSSRCIRTVTVFGGTSCVSSRYDLHVTDLRTGHITLVGGFSVDEGTGAGQAAFSPDGARIALWSRVGLRIYRQ